MLRITVASGTEGLRDLTPSIPNNAKKKKSTELTNEIQLRKEKLGLQKSQLVCQHIIDVLVKVVY